MAAHTVVIDVIAMKCKIRNTSFSFASVPKCESCALNIRTFFVEMFEPLHVYAPNTGSDFSPYLASYHSMTEREQRRLVQDSFRLNRFLSDLVSLYYAR